MCKREIEREKGRLKDRKGNNFILKSKCFYDVLYLRIYSICKGFIILRERRIFIVFFIEESCYPRSE